MDELERLRRALDEERAARRAAENERDQLKRFFDEAPAVMSVNRGPSLVYEFANQTLKQVLRLSQGDPIGLPAREALAFLGDGHPLFAALEHVVTSGESLSVPGFSTRLRRQADGPLEPAYFDFSFQAIRDADGRVDGLLAFGAEVTARVQAEAERRASQERYEALARTATQFVWGTGPSGLVDDMPEWRAFTGQTPDEVRGTGWANAVHPDDRAATAAAWAAAVDARGLYDVTYRVQHHAGGHRWLHVRGVPVLEPDGAIREWVGTANDVTIQREAEAAMAEAHRQLARQARELQAANEELTSQAGELQAQQDEMARLYDALRRHSERIETERDQFWNLSLDLLDVVGLDGYLKAVNPAWTSVLGWTEEELKAQPFMAFVHPDDVEATLGEMGKLAAGADTLHFENRFVTRTGAYRSIEWTARPYGELLFAYGRDVTERKVAATAIAQQNAELQAVNEALAAQAEALLSQQGELRVANERLHQQKLATEHERRFIEGLVNHLPGGVAYWDTDLVYRMVNPLYAKVVCNQPPEFYLGHVLMDLLPDTRGAIEAGFREVIATGEPWKQLALPLMIPRDDGEEQTYWDFELHAMRDAEGRVTGLLAMVFEATRRVRLEREMVHQQALTSQVIDEAPAGIAYLDDQLIFRRVNATYARFMGLPASAIEGVGVGDLLAGEAGDTIIPLLRGVIETGEVYHGTSFRFPYAPHGEPRMTHWDFTFSPVRRDGALTGVLVLATEVGDRVEKEQLQVERIASLEAMDRYKDEFLSVISHELRTPLNFITGFASTLDDEVQGPLNERQHGAVGKILAGADRMLALVDDLLDFAKLQSGRFELSKEPADYAGLIKEVLSLMQPLAESKRIGLSMAVDVPLAPMIDARRVSQVLVNLVNNALKFSEPGGHVVVSAGVEGQALVTRVTDTGLGIAEADMPKLFARFQQLDMSATRRAGGTGLGLAISKALIEAHGGVIGVESELNVGSTFYFRLPLD